MKVSILSIRVLFIALCILCAVNKVSFAQQRTLSFTTNSITPAASMVLPNKLALQNLPCGVYTSGLCDQATYKKFNLVYKLKVQDPDPTAAIYTVGRNAFNVTCTLNTKFVNCTTPANITQIDMGPTGGIQSTAIMNLSGNGINNPTTETILTIPFELGGMNNNCFALLNTDYVQTTLTNVAITGINHNFVRLEAYIEEVNVTYTNIAVPVQTKPLPVAGSSKVNFAWKGCSPMFQLQVLKMYNIENSKLLENDINIHTDDYSYNSNSRSWFEALTINVIGNSKELTLVDGTGFYIWRVRALNNTFPGGEANPNNWGPWSSMWSNLSTPAVIPVNIGNTAAVPSIFYYNQFDNAKNWIYTRNFIEGASPWNNDLKETILGESIRYANGLGMVKQSQGFNNQANEVMVSETLQDYVGRDVMQTLPAASGQTKLGYIDNLLQGYNESNFDADATYKNVNPLPSNSIIAQYYSDINTDLGVPNADGFAFTRTRFNRSPLNEVRESCLAGGELTMKTVGSHTNKLITGDVADIELVRIFGEEAPNPANVMKNITMDANQSINVTYVDKAGKTIATCLSKEPGKNLEPLASAAQANFNIEYFLTGGVAGADPYEIVETKTIPIGKPTTLNFEYKLEQKKIEYLCKTLCTTCDYVVDFKVVFEEEPNVVLWQNSVTIDPTTIQCNNLTGTLDPIPFDNPAVPPSFLASEFGNYIVTKTVRYHNNNAASIPYIDEYTNTLQQAIDASVYSASADWIVCDAAGLPITGLPQISIYDLSTKLSNKMMTGANGVYSMLGINPINNIPVVRILKKDPLVAGGQSPCDAKFSLTITPCPEVTCPDPLIFEDQLISMFQDALNYHNGTYPACTMSTNLMDHFIVYNQVYTIEFSGQQIQLDGNDMKTVIDNMIYDYNHQNIPNDVGKNYSCENILAAWEMAIEAYFSEAASICQNPTNAAVAANNDFLDKFFTTIGYRLVGSTHLPSQAGGYGYKTHPYRCFFMPDQWNPNPPGSNVFTYINANPSTAFSAAILNGNSLHNAAKPVTCPFLPLPTNPSDIAGYFDPNYGILDLQVIQPCDKSEATLLNFYRAIQYQLNANLFSVFGIPSGATYDNLLSLKQQNERLCRRICQANHDMYEDAITTEFALPSLNNASVGLVEDYQVPLGYSSNSSLLPARNNIAINWVETYAQMAVDNCKSKCNLTIQGTNCPGPNCVMTAIGTPEEQAEFMKATTMGAKIYLTTSFENVNPTTQMPDREYWMSLYNDPCVSCMDFKGNPINGGGGCDENEVQNNTISLYPLSNIDGFLYKSCCPTLAPTNVLSIYPMEHIDYNRDVISQNSYQSNYLAFSPDKETGVAYDLMPWLTQKLNAQIANGPATGTLNIYDMVYNYVNPVSDDLSASNAIAHTFSADDNAAGSEQLESDPGVGGHKKTISYNNLGFDMMVGVKTFVTNSVTANLIPLTIKRTHSTQLAMHGYMKVKVEVTPPAGYVGDVTYKDILNDYTTSNHKIAFIIDNPREIYTSGNEVIMTKSFSPLNTKPLVLEYLVRIKKSNFSPFGTNEINNSDLLAITSAAIPLPNQAEYPVHYARGLVATSGAFVAVGPAYEVNIPSLRIYNPQIKPDAQVLASFATGPNPEDDIQNAYTVTNTGIIPGNVPPEMSVNKYVQVVALSYNSLEVEIDPKTKNPKIDANGNPIVNQVTNVLWPYFNNHKVFQPASICMQYIPFQIKDSMDQLGPTSCNDALANDLLSSLSDQVQNIKDAAVQELKSKYYNICGVYGLNDEFKVWYEEGYHHYTLYYYNRAGNLIRTVAPEGVDCVPKANDRNTLQKYKQATLYDYNSLNQVVKSRSQDGGETQFIYDNLGRLRFSQNAKQLLNGKCSYMKYDELGRVTESGEHSFAGAFSVLQSQAGIITYPTSNIREVVRTVYTNAYPINYLVGATPQQNLLNRVSYTVSMKDPTAATALLRGEVVNVFSYDLSGNAVWTAQKIMDLPFNYMRYEFDMLSGAVLKTVYNEGAVDAFYHRYQYDANKKLLCVETSQDGYQWDKDARYTYYKHGPLKNTIIGHDKIQSVDYAYTINGWLKAINHPGLSKEKNADYLSNVNTAMNDVFATKIQYFPTDFTRTGSPYNFTETGPNAYNYVPTTVHDLYNGNISAILTSNVSSLQTTVSDNAVKFHVNDYHFDELHRLLSVDYGTRNTITGEYAVTNNSYQENFKYDANGNLRKANRFDYSTTSPQKIDDFEYNYANDIIGNNSSAANNRLTSLSESGINIAAYKDIKQGTAKNYTYEAIGNLTNDSDEGLNVSWNVAGKVEQVTKLVGVNLYTYKYYYDAFGNRVAKSTAKDANPPTWEYYLRDAQGNIMANYARTAGASPTITTTERPIYGAARVGLQNKAITYFNGSATALATQNYPNPLNVGSYAVNRIVGDKRYELSDHLSNVRNIFTDLRLSTRSGAASPNYLLSNYKTEDRALYNFYAYGMPKTGRNDYVEFTPSLTYRYGFNEQMKTDELAGVGNHNTALFWEYDTRLGRRWNLDPVDQVNISNYAVNGLNPLIYSDPKGDLFGIKGFGSTKAQRVAAREYAEQTGGKVEHLLSKNIDVDHPGAKTKWDPETRKRIVTIIAHMKQFFNEDGSLYDDSPKITPYTPSLTQKWSSSSNPVASGTYGIANGLYQLPQLFSQSFNGGFYNLDGSQAVRGSKEHLDAFFSGATMFVPAGEAKSGIQVLSKVNASQFSKFFKGTTIASASPSTRGAMIKFINNQVVTRINKQVATGKLSNSLIKSGAKSTSNNLENTDNPPKENSNTTVGQ